MAVASVNPRVLKLDCIPGQVAWSMRLAKQLAKAIILRLKAICCGLNFASFRGQHCTAVETQVITTASAALRLPTAVSRNGRLTDMLPLIPGSLTFIRDVTAASTRTARAKYVCSVWLTTVA